MSPSTRWLIGVGGLVVAAALASAVVAMLASGVDEFPEGTPERAVQQYLAAVADRDATEAFTYLAPDLVEECGTFAREPITQRGSSRFRAALEDTVPHGDGVEVQVALTESYGDPPFDSGESTWTVTFRLEQRDGEWRFVEAPWPTYCANPKPLPAPGVR